ncbi:MAG: DNA polymerase III subunit delta [Phycisphaerales bacterium]|nr:DNA polymerase III subunit delta [Phycisphaerales bacterium]
MTRTGPCKPICVIHGKNAFTHREALARIIDRELDGGDPALNMVRVNGDGASCSDVLDDVRTMCMLGGRRVVVVEDADDFVSRHRAALERYAESPTDGGCLVLVCRTFLPKTNLGKRLKEIGEIIECEELPNQAVPGWVVSRAREAYQKRVSREAAAMLCEHAGRSQETLDAELAKLAIYVGARESIDGKDVDAMVVQYREHVVFAVMDAIADGDTRKALSEWQRVVATDRAAPGRAIGGLAFGLRRLLDMRSRLDGGEPLHSIGRGYFAPPEVLKRRLQRCTRDRLENQLADLLRADLESKTGLGTFESAVEKFIIRHGGAAKAG